MRLLVELSILIVNYNTGHLVAPLVESIHQFVSPVTYEVLVLDNASTDTSAEYLGNLPVGPGRVHVTFSKDNLGFPEGNNALARRATGQFVYLLNPDTLLCDHSIGRMVQYLTQHPEVAVVGSRLREVSGHIQRTAWRKPSPLTLLFGQLLLDQLFPKSALFGSRHYSDWDRTTTREVEALSGASLMTRRTVWEQLGGLDPELFYGEDADFCLRAPGQVHYLAHATILHYGGESTKSDRYPRIYFPRRSAVLMLRKHGGSAAAFLGKCIIMAEVIFRLPLEGVYLLLRKNRDVGRVKALARLLLEIPQL